MSQAKIPGEFEKTNNILDRFKKAFELSSDAELARFLEINPSTVATWRKAGTMKYDRIIEFCEDLNLNWLFYGDLPVWKSEKKQKSDLENEEFLRKKVSYYQSVFINDDGQMIPQESSDCISIDLPSTFIYNKLQTTPEDLFVTRSVGDSMEPTIFDRDFITVQKTITPPYAGRIYLLRMNESILCKRIHEHPGKKLLIISDNKRYADIEICPDEENFEIVGRIVSYSRSL